jgi:hypothetical protein
MKLTQNTKSEFYKWYQKRLSVMTRMDLLNINDQTVYNSLIIEFFDSIGIYIEVSIDKYLTNVIFDAYVDNEWIGTSFRTRSEATEGAIEAANYFYNQSCSPAE